MTAGLLEFLRERLNADEQAARIISCGGFAPEVWRAEPVRSGRWMQIIPYERETNEPPEAECRASDSPTVLVANNRAEWAHIERWDPARVLAEVNAKRRIIDAHPITTSAINPGYGKTGAGFGCETCHDWDGATEGYGYCQTLKLLALPYVDHPDYREEWQV